MSAYQPKTGAKCDCRPGIERDNCPVCEGTGMRIDFQKIRAANKPRVAREIDSETATVAELRAWYVEVVGYDPMQAPENATEAELRSLVAGYREEEAADEAAGAEPGRCSPDA